MMGGGGMGMGGIPPPPMGANRFGGGMGMPGMMGGMPMGGMGGRGPFGVPHPRRMSFAGGMPMPMGMGMPGGGVPFGMPQRAKMNGMGRGGNQGPNNFDPSRFDRPKTPRGRRASFGARTRTPGMQDRVAREQRNEHPKSPGFALRPDQQGVRFRGHHEGARFGPFDAPANMRNVRPHHYGLRPEAQPRTVGEIFRGGDVPNQGFVIVKKMTPGGMSTAVNLVKNVQTGKLYVEKRIRADGPSRKPAGRELKTLLRISNMYGSGGNLNTLVTHKVLKDGMLVSLILDHCDVGSLMDLLKNTAQTGNRISEVSMWNILQGVASGLAFLHNGITNIDLNHEPQKIQGWDTICHLDIKPQNIFLDSKGGQFGQPRIVLADFGCAVLLSSIHNGEEQAQIQPCGTPEWYPPEGDINNPRFYGTKTDMWSLGLTIHVLCRQLLKPKVFQCSRDNVCGSAYGQRLNSMVRGLTSSYSSKRPPARQVAQMSMAVLQEKAQGGGGRRRL